MSVSVRPSTEPTSIGAPAAPTTAPERRNVPSRIGQSVLAATAMIAGASSLASVVSGRSWVLPLIEVVMVIWLVGVGGRLLQLPAAGTVLLQTAAFLIALTSLFTTGGVGGVLPDAAALAQARSLFVDAVAQVAGTSPPTASTPALSFLIALTIGCAALAADILVTVAASPALVALPLLCLYAVPASMLDTTLLPWYAFAAPAVLYMALLWMPNRQGRQAGARDSAGAAWPGLAITALTMVAALTVAGASTVIGTAGRMSRAASSGVAVSPFASLQGSLRSSTAVTVLTAAGLTTPDYFSTVALTTWTANRGWSLGQVQADLNSRAGNLAPSTVIQAGSPVTVTAVNLQDRFLPILPGTAAITGLADTWSYDSALRTVFRPVAVNPGRYLLTVEAKKPDRRALQADTAAGGGDLTDTGPLSPLVRSTAQQVTAAQNGPFDKAAALQRWFTDPANGFTYSLDVPAQDTGDALVNFLTHKQGYCQQYASAMAIMLRSVNVPARVVIGYTQGNRRADGSYLITSRNAHAWVEVKFRDNGWVRFDPTPPVNGQGGQQGFTDNTDASAITTQSTAPPLPATESNPPRDERPSPKDTQTAAPARTDLSSTNDADPGASWTPVALLTLSILAAAAAGLAAPTALRRRRRRRRLAITTSGGAAAAASAWDELEDTAIDHHLYPQPTESARAIANRIARRAQLGPTDRTRLRQLVLQVETGWYCPSPSSGTAIRGDLLDVHDGQAGASTATLTRADTIPGSLDGADFAAVVRAVIDGMHTYARVRGADRVFPPSLRGGVR